MSPEPSISDLPRLKRVSQAPKAGIVHLGPGAFFRAFNAVYTHEAMELAGGDWGIVAVSLRSPTARDQLEPQDGVFTSVTLSQDAPRTRVIGSIVQTLVAPEDPSAVVNAMANEGTKIVSLTVTEKGYCHEPATGALNLGHPDIVHDLEHHEKPRSAVGFIVQALDIRRRAGHAPFTVLSCDNLPSNGELVRGTVLEFARERDAELADWIAQNVAFPATMVDRITPATTDEDVQNLGREQGYYDPACVLHEAFRQWVIEDNFVNGRPDWDQLGAQFVASVDAHELMKLRCLNGTHSTLAYLGYLAGYETIAETVSDPAFAKLCEILWATEITPTIPKPDGEDLPAYCASLMARYQEPSVRHRTWQIAMDGSQKLPQRILGTVSDLLAMGREPRGLALAVAAWMRYVGGVDENADAIDVRDPMAAELKAASDSGSNAEKTVDALLAMDGIFSTELATNDAFRNLVVAAYQTLEASGARAAVKAFVSS